MDIGAWVDTRRAYSSRNNGAGINVKTDIEVEIEELEHNHHHHHHHHHSQSTRPMQHNNGGDTEMPDSSSSAEEDEDEESDSDSTSNELSSSVGFSLNARLLHAAALRESSGAMNIPMDPEWEQYLKEASERGELNIDATREALRTMAGQIAQLHQSTVEAESSEAVPQTFQPPAAPA